MSLLSTLYAFEAEMPDGSVMTQGGDLRGAVRVSLIPMEGTLLPRHDLVGVQFERRFMRYFKRSPVGGFDKAAYFAEIERNLSDDRKAARAARDAAGHAPAQAEAQPAPPPKMDECVQVVVCDKFRLYVRHSDGSALVTPHDYELYL